MSGGGGRDGERSVLRASNEFLLCPIRSTVCVCASVCLPACAPVSAPLFAHSVASVCSFDPGGEESSPSGATVARAAQTGRPCRPGRGDARTDARARLVLGVARTPPTGGARMSRTGLCGLDSVWLWRR